MSFKPRDWQDANPSWPLEKPVLAPCCGRPVAPDMLQSVEVVPVAIRVKVKTYAAGQDANTKQFRQEAEKRARAIGPDTPIDSPPTEAFMCDACRERMFREGHLDRIEYMRLHGADQAEMDRIEAKLAADPYAIGRPVRRE